MANWHQEMVTCINCSAKCQNPSFQLCSIFKKLDKVTIVIPIIELEKPFFPTSFQIVSYLLKMQYKVFDKVVFSCFIMLLCICFENEGF